MTDLIEEKKSDTRSKKYAFECIVCKWNNLEQIRVTRLYTTRSERITMRKQLFAARCNSVTPVSRELLREWSEGRKLLSRMTCYFYINVAGREVNESPVLSVKIVVRVSFPPPANQCLAPTPPQIDWSWDDRNKRVSSLRQTHPTFTSIVTLRTEISEKFPLYQQQMPFGQSSSLRAQCRISRLAYSSSLRV